MHIGEALRFSLDALRANKIRTFLTALGLVIGNASVILVVTISLTSRDYILEQIRGIARMGAAPADPRPPTASRSAAARSGPRTGPTGFVGLPKAGSAGSTSTCVTSAATGRLQCAPKRPVPTACG